MFIFKRISTATKFVTSTLLMASLLAGSLHQNANAEVTNWESPHVNPMDLTPNNNTLLVVNTADAKLEVFSFVNGIPSLINSIPVGLDPVSVRARSNTEAWVVNHVSDSISIVDLTRGIVTHTLKTEDEPADVIFAGTANRAFVTASQANMVQVFNPNNLSAAPTNIAILGEDPRTLAVSPDGNTVYAAIFESGNASTIIRGGRDYSILPRAGFGEYRGVDDASSPYAGQNPPPNNGNSFSPAINPAVSGNIPNVSMIVKKDASGRWMDDNNGDWSEMVNGELTPGFDHNASGRIPGWDMPDNDVAIINANNLSLSYQSSLMNMVMGLAVNPANGRVTAVGTEAHNEIRFEPNLRSHFITVTFADFVAGNANSRRIRDLNPHIDPDVEFLPRAQREESLGDPRHITWDTSGNGFITGMGSNTLVRINNNGTRNANVASVKVGKGPTASIIHNNNVIVLNRFDASLSVVAGNTFTETATVDFYDPTPEEINIGRVQFYDTHETSGMGQVSCASCHVDGKHDRLAWDLGDPSADYTIRNGIQFHPMKGPLRTSLLAGIVGSPALHFRGDKDDIASFNGTFTNLQGLNDARTDSEMTELETFIASMHTPPNPFRNIDNTMPTALSIPGPEERIGNPNGRAATCNRCHVVADNGRTDVQGQVGGFNSPGQQPTIAPSLRSMYEILGFTYSFDNLSTAGFGYIADGVMDPQTQNTLSNNNSLAFMMAYNGDLPNDTHAGVGTQITLNGEQTEDDRSTLDRLVELAEADAIGLIAHGLVENKAESAGFTYLSGSGGRYQTQTVGNTITHATLISNASVSNPITFTAVPKGSEVRAGIDRDENGVFDDVVTVPSRIQAEAFVNAFDTTAGTQRGAGFIAGYEHVNVDVTTSTGTGDGTPKVGWITAGEWLQYNVYSRTAQSLNLILHAASPLDGQRINVLLNGRNVGTINVTNTGGYNNFQISEAVTNITFAANSNNELRLVFETGGLDLNYLELTTELPTVPVTPVTPETANGQVCFFENADWSYTGLFGNDYRACIGTSAHNFGIRKGHNNTVSAVSVGSTVSAILYDGTNYTGQSLCIDSNTDLNTLGTFNNIASSFRVITGACTVTVTPVDPVEPVTPTGPGNEVTNAEMNVDGNNSEWSNLDLFANDTNDLTTNATNHINWLRAGIAHSSNTVYLLYQNRSNVNPEFTTGTFLNWGWQTYMDTDNNSSTGYGATGAEVLIEGDRVYRFAGSDTFVWDWTDVGAATLSYNNTVAELSFPRSLLGAHQVVNLSFLGNNAAFGGNTIDLYPNNGTFEYDFGSNAIAANTVASIATGSARSSINHETTVINEFDPTTSIEDVVNNDDNVITEVATTNASTSSGGGSMSWALLLFLGFLMMNRRRIVRTKYSSQDYLSV